MAIVPAGERPPPLLEPLLPPTRPDDVLDAPLLVRDAEVPTGCVGVVTCVITTTDGDWVTPLEGGTLTTDVRISVVGGAVVGAVKVDVVAGGGVVSVVGVVVAGAGVVVVAGATVAGSVVVPGREVVVSGMAADIVRAFATRAYGKRMREHGKRN
jgi:hypothetical protein